MSATDLDRFDDLVSRYLDDVLTEADSVELLASLAEPPLAARFLEMTRLNSELAGVLAAPVPNEAMVELVRADIQEHLAAAQPVVVPMRPMTPRRNFVPWALAWAAVFLMFAGAATVWFVNRERRAAAPTVVTPSVAAPSLAMLQGEVRLTGLEGERALKPGESWQRGETLKTVGAKSAATVTFEDGTRLDFAGDSVAVNQSSAEGRRVELAQGGVQCVVKHQPARQTFTFATPDAEAVVVGTTLEVTAIDAHHTRVVVTEGEVLVRRRSDGAEIMVGAGFHVFMGPKMKLTASPNDPKQRHR